MADDRGERTEPASPRKREEARERGQVARSPDLTTAAALCAGLAALAAVGQKLVGQEVMFIQRWLNVLGSREDLAVLLRERFTAMAFPVLISAVVILLVIEATAIAVGFSQVGFHFTPKFLELDWDRISPLNRLRQIFSMSTIFTALLGLAKLSVISVAAYLAISALVGTAPQWWQMPVGGLFKLGSTMAGSLAWTIAIPMLLLGLVDYGYKRWRFEQDLMMTRQEVREENRQLEGDPHIKQRIRQIQRQRAQRRMFKDIPKATVVITNPTHVAVALRYESGGNGAPIVVAKGEHLIAQRIKAVAASHGIPLIEEPPLARALNRTTQVGQEIPLEFYRAVAAILASLYRRQATGLPTGGRV